MWRFVDSLYLVILTGLLQMYMINYKHFQLESCWLGSSREIPFWEHKGSSYSIYEFFSGFVRYCCDPFWVGYSPSPHYLLGYSWCPFALLLCFSWFSDSCSKYNILRSSRFPTRSTSSTSTIVTIIGTLDSRYLTMNLFDLYVLDLVKMFVRYRNLLLNLLDFLLATIHH